MSLWICVLSDLNRLDCVVIVESSDFSAITTTMYIGTYISKRNIHFLLLNCKKWRVIPACLRCDLPMLSCIPSLGLDNTEKEFHFPYQKVQWLPPVCFHSLTDCF